MSGTGGARRWKLGADHSAEQWRRRIQQRGRTAEQIDGAIQYGQSFTATITINPAHGATRHVHPTTGSSVVLDDTTDEVIHVGGDGFVYG